MCGIAGLRDFGGNSTEADLLAMTRTLVRRGPDDCGFFFSRADSIGLGHRRLSIIDLSVRGRQPMTDNDGSLRIIFNGEIYNYREVRQELVGRGYCFTSNTDTEVILYGYKEWGTRCVSHFRGMFAIALWDQKLKKLFLFRDRLGVKPLYYYYDQDLLLFASEIKALIAHPGFTKRLSADGLALYLKLGYVPAPWSIFSSTYKVRPGCFIEISSDGGLKEYKYWSVSDSYSENGEPKKDHKCDEQVEDELRSLLREAFAYRLVADVPVGIFLSGGIDSSLVTAILKREVGESVRTFTVGFDDANADESHWARAVADHLGADHTELHCAKGDALEIAPKLCEVYDEPFSDASAIPTYLLCKAAREQVKVALSADGGDEFFCGYGHYTMFAPVWQRLASLPGPVRAALSGVLKQMGAAPTKVLEPLLAAVCHHFLPGLEPADLADKLAKLSQVMRANELRDAYASAISVWPEYQVNNIAPGLQPANAQAFANGGRITDTYLDMMLADAQTYLPDDLMVKVDRASMSVGLEVREPLLDHKVVEYAVALPNRFKYNGGVTKAILKGILYRHVPQDLLDRPKHGFNVPLTEWLKSPLKPLVMETLEPGRIRRQGLFCPTALEKVVQGFMAGGRISSKKVWNLLQFQLWYQRWVE